MSQQELLKYVVSLLNSLQIDYMFTGSIVSSMQGEPRHTHDLDLLVDLAESKVAGLVASFPPDQFYVSENAIREAIQNKSMFNVISLRDGNKIDFWMLTDSPFDQSRFSRKLTTTLFAVSTNISQPEDTILSKLLWAQRSGGSVKQLTDAIRVLELQHENMDIPYLDRWSNELGVSELWKQINDEAVIE